MSDKKLLSSTEFLRQMKEAGLWHNYRTMLKKERQGLLTIPREPTMRADRKLTQSMIDEIIEAFKPGGKGQWHYDERQS